MMYNKKKKPETLALEMTQKKKKKCVSSQSHGNLANRKVKKSIVYTKKANLSNEIIITNTEKLNQIRNGEEEEEEFNLSRCQHKKKKKSVRTDKICKGKSIVKPSNNSTDQMQIDEVKRIYLHEEIMTDILSRLPVRSVVRFKCVSKFWNSLISHRYFRMQHYINWRNDQNSQKILTAEANSQKILTAEALFTKRRDLYCFSTSSLSTVQVVEDKQKLDWPSSCKPKNVIIFCSCDGLVLIFVSSRELCRHSSRPYEELLLWNPSTRESSLIPHPEFQVVDCVYGLGYDAISDGYKILAINLNANNRFDTSIEVFSFKSRSWRRIGYPTGIKRVCGFRNCGMDYLPFVHGAFHWLVMSLSRYYTIVSFNISNEVYAEVPLLEQMCHVCRSSHIVDRGVSALRGLLCFYSTNNHSVMGTDCTFKLWIMKDYGVRESWINFINIRDTNFFHSARPKYMFADCQVLLHCKRLGCVCSTITTCRGPFEPYNPQCECVIVKQGIAYTESLISPKVIT